MSITIGPMGLGAHAEHIGGEQESQIELIDNASSMARARWSAGRESSDHEPLGGQRGFQGGTAKRFEFWIRFWVEAESTVSGLAENNLSACGYFSAVFSSQHLSLIQAQYSSPVYVAISCNYPLWQHSSWFQMNGRLFFLQ